MISSGCGVRYQVSTSETLRTSVSLIIPYYYYCLGYRYRSPDLRYVGVRDPVAANPNRPAALSYGCICAMNAESPSRTRAESKEGKKKASGKWNLPQVDRAGVDFFGATINLVREQG